MNNAKGKLSSWRSAQQQIGSILAALNEDSSLMLAAAANPLFALEDLGYEISDEVRQEFEDRIRFGPEGTKEIESLREEIFTIAGSPFDLNSSEAVYGTLSGLLGRKPHKGKRDLTVADTIPLPTAAAIQTAKAHERDPLEHFSELHPIMKPLLAYRRLEASIPRLATREVYQEIRQGKRTVPITKLVAHLHGK